MLPGVSFPMRKSNTISHEDILSVDLKLIDPSGILNQTLVQSFSQFQLKPSCLWCEAKKAYRGHSKKKRQHGFNTLMNYKCLPHFIPCFWGFLYQILHRCVTCSLRHILHAPENLKFAIKQSCRLCDASPEIALFFFKNMTMAKIIWDPLRAS